MDWMDKGMHEWMKENKIEKNGEKEWGNELMDEWMKEWRTNKELTN